MAFNAFAERVGADFPIFAFSHCRDVVVEVSKAGGVGVLGAARMSPEHLEVELRAIDEALGGRPYGVDILFPRPPSQAAGGGEPAPGDFAERRAAAVSFARAVAAGFGIASPAGESRAEANSFVNGPLASHERAAALAEVALRHPVRLIVSALGPLPEAYRTRAAQQGALVGGSVGDVRHVRAHLAVGADFIIAQGHEAGGHTGRIATSVLVPDVVDAAGSTPVLAAGGIGSGRQIAAALAWGAQAVWIGSLWLTTVESDVQEELRGRLLRASSADAVITQSISGRTMRVLRNGWTDKWAAPGSPPVLPMPHQGLAVRPFMQAAIDGANLDVMTTPVGQVVSRMSAVRRTADVMFDLISELLDTLSALTRLGASFSEGGGR